MVGDIFEDYYFHENGKEERIEWEERIEQKLWKSFRFHIFLKKCIEYTKEEIPNF